VDRARALVDTLQESTERHTAGGTSP
jgi:hypothetical protein